MIRRSLLAAVVALGLPRPAHAGEEEAAASVNISGVGLPVIAEGRVRNYVFVSLRLHLGRGANAEAVHNTRQNRVATTEIPVGAFTLVNASLTWRPRGKNGAFAFILSGENLLDEVGRLATSETRDFVPIAGRNIRMTVTLKI